MKFKPQPPPAQCLTAEDHERALVLMAAELEGHARRLLATDLGDKSTRILLATGNQIAVSAIKARCAAADLARRREDIENLDYLMEHERRMLGVRGPSGDRPRLKLHRRGAA